MKKAALYLLVMGTLLASCKKEVPYAQEGITAVSIEFNFPDENEQITVGEETHIEGIIDKIYLNFHEFVKSEYV